MSSLLRAPRKQGVHGIPPTRNSVGFFYFRLFRIPCGSGCNSVGIPPNSVTYNSVKFRGISRNSVTFSCTGFRISPKRHIKKLTKAVLASRRGIILYIEYQSVCPLVGIGSPIPRKRVCLPSWTQGGSNTRLRMRGPNSDKQTESLALFIFCEASYINIHTCTTQRRNKQHKKRRIVL